MPPAARLLPSGAIHLGAVNVQPYALPNSGSLYVTSYARPLSHLSQALSITYELRAQTRSSPPFGSASAPSTDNKEAANPAMTFTLFSIQHFPKYRSALRDGNFHRLS
jgi:hypothetical protein